MGAQVEEEDSGGRDILYFAEWCRFYSILLLPLDTFTSTQPSFQVNVAIVKSMRSGLSEAPESATMHHDSSTTATVFSKKPHWLHFGSVGKPTETEVFRGHYAQTLNLSCLSCRKEIATVKWPKAG